MRRLEGKTALITGGTSGIGLATAKLFLSEGAKVAVTGRSAKAIEEARRELGPQAIVLASNAGALGDIRALADTVKDELGGLDVLFANAGIARFVPFSDVDEALYDETFDVNVKGIFFLVQALAKHLRPGGAVVLNTSIVDEKGFATTNVYAASKAAVRSLARTFAAELLPRGIRVNAVSPGPIATPIYSKLGLSAEALAGFEGFMRDSNPMKRFGTSEEVARAVLFFAAEATYTTGAELVVDGGATQL